MNKKLTRLEYKETKKIMLLITALITVYMLISAGCTVAFYYSTTDTALIIKTVLVLISALLVICSAMMMAKRYYNLLFSDEGYSRLSFPVTNRAHLHANLKCSFIWLGLQTLVFLAGLGLSDIFTKYSYERWGIGNLYPAILRGYKMNILGNYLSAPELKAVITVLILLIASLIIAANIYLSFIFTLTVSNYICGKYNIVQKNGVIIITGIVMFNIYLLTGQTINDLLFYFRFNCLDRSGYDIFGPDILFIFEIYEPVTYILFCGITGFVMYRISRAILDKKLDI